MSLLLELKWINKDLIHHDIRHSEHEEKLKLAIAHANRVWSPKWEEVVCDGEIHDQDTFTIIIGSLDDASGNSYAELVIEDSILKGVMGIYAPKGKRIQDLISQDPGKAVAGFWRNRMMLDHDHPMEVEMLVTKDNGFLVEVRPWH